MLMHWAGACRCMDRCASLATDFGGDETCRDERNERISRVRWRLAAAWALIGFSTRISIAFGTSLSDGIRGALGHYLAWGLAGFVAGFVVEIAIAVAVDPTPGQRALSRHVLPEGSSMGDTSSN